MHESVMDWVAACVTAHDLDRGRVLDIGSLDVNGTTRGLFANATQYVGLDIREGRGVDTVGSSHNLRLRFGFHAFDTVACTEMLEHDSDPHATMSEVARVLIPGGHCLFTARGICEAQCQDCTCGRPHGFGMHGEPNDYWRFTAQTFPMLFDTSGIDTIDVIEDTQAPGWFAIGQKQ